MAELESGNAEGIVNCLKSELKKFKLNIKNLIGIGTDNASVMVGCNKSVYTELKKEVPHLILIQCVCHSVQLATNYACKECLPRNLEFLVYETYNWFKSSSRQSAYKLLYETINNGMVIRDHKFNYYFNYLFNSKLTKYLFLFLFYFRNH